MLRSTLCAILLGMSALALADTTITYQGQLQNNGQPFDGQADLTFELFDDFDPNDPNVGNSVAGPISVNDVDISDGLFQADLDFGAVYEQPVWIEVTVGTDTLHPRQRLTAAPVAVRALNFSSPSGVWKLGGNEGIDPGTDYLGTSDTIALELRVNNQRALKINPIVNLPTGVDATGPNLVGGWTGNTINSSAVGSSILGGGAVIQGTDHPNIISADAHWSVINGGIDNTVHSTRSAIGGGRLNTITAASSVIGGGFNNEASGGGSTIAGGFLNMAVGPNATVGGGNNNSANGHTSTIAGGFANEASGEKATIPGGAFNLAAGNYSLAAGNRAKAEHDGAFVWADFQQDDFTSTAPDQFLIRAGGGVGINTNAPMASLDIDGLTRVGQFASESSVPVCKSVDGVLADCDSSLGVWTEHYNGIGYTLGNLQVDLRRTTLAGPEIEIGHPDNVADGAGAAVLAGGAETYPNLATSNYATVAGGIRNHASGSFSTVSGGFENIASGNRSTIPGGNDNVADGSRSFAAGNRAKALHDGTFVWSGGLGGDFESTAEKQFLIRASGGVGINENAPESNLHIMGSSPDVDAQAQLLVESFETSGAEGTGAGIAFLGHDGNIRRRWGRILNVKENDTVGDTRARMSFYVRGGSGLPQEQMRIESDGTTVNSNGSWATFSDLRLKKDIEPIDQPLGRLLSLKGIMFEYIEDTKEPILKTDQTRMGFIAQDVETVFPEWVREGSNGFKQVSLVGFEALTVESIRELARQQSELRSAIAERDASIERLAVRLESLEAENERLRADHARRADLENRLTDLEALMLNDRSVTDGR
ncbi:MULTISPECIES: tail fiber domain-containing protein [unclassified Wenzhouxiangella]|uniref:tail fiber domain-containing protein n=1 Tax=unclassified Wenzhouxiangella TaxID=2613841 RepID=UPI000E325282|nr:MULTISPECIES: tail fiber domain-containing protein [unclassified Wenzhouxiangella]RFF27557.1 hypothetical protein DZK25_07675 [Wenzhouxiangella sp. 15181]RFP69581.1 hypothetical protein DZK26_02970 [Wenzhouxiangella sp. 15190]